MTPNWDSEPEATPQPPQPRSLLLSVMVFAIKEKEPEETWTAYSNPTGLTISGGTYFDAIRNYLEWCQVALLSNEPDEAIAQSMGVAPSWIPAMRAQARASITGGYQS